MGKKITVPIKGMHCHSCEMLVEDKLSKVSGVKKVNVDYRKGQAEIECESGLNQNKIKDAVNAAGYVVGKDEKPPFLSKNLNDYKDLGFAVVALVAIYFVLADFGLTHIDISTSNPSGLSVVLLVGLTAGVSSCMALIGGLILGISGSHAEKHPEATALQKFRPHMFFNLGRVFGFALLGGILGTVGSALRLSVMANGVITILVGLLMFILGFQLIGIFPWLDVTNRFALPKKMGRMLGIKETKEYNHFNAAVLGALTFFLPCGFTQAMQVYAISTGNFVSGALVMGTFALGTVPGLLSVGGLTSVIKGNFSKKLFKLVGLAVIFFGLFNMHNGFTLTGFNLDTHGKPSSQGAAIKSDPNVQLQNGVQVIHMTENASGYSPNVFTIQKGIPVRWIINATDPYSCASAVVSQQLGIDKQLKPGENTIEFTPKETGSISFSCSMGMYTGAFNVVDGGNAAAPESQPAAQNSDGSGNSDICNIQSNGNCDN